MISTLLKSLGVDDDMLSEFEQHDISSEDEQHDISSKDDRGQLHMNDLACIYLVDTTMRDGDATVYKFGRSGKIKDRFYDHHFTFGAGTLLDTIIFVPGDKLSETETILRNSVSKENQFRYDKAEELVILDNADYNAVRTIMQTIADKYNGSMTIQVSKHVE